MPVTSVPAARAIPINAAALICLCALALPGCKPATAQRIKSKAQDDGVNFELLPSEKIDLPALTTGGGAHSPATSSLKSGRAGDTPADKAKARADEPSQPVATGALGRFGNVLPNVPFINVKAEIVSGFSFGLSSSVGVEKISSGSFARYDTFAFKADASPFKLLGDRVATLFPFSFDSGHEITFTRYFPSRSAAMALSDLNPAIVLRAPVDARRTLELNEDEAVYMSSRGRIVARMPAFLSAMTSGGANAQPYLAFECEMRSFVQRLKGNRVSLSLTALPFETRGVEGKAATPLVGLGKATAALELEWKKVQGRRLEYSFELDLDHAEVREAFDRALSGRVRVRGKAVTGPAKGFAEEAIAQWSALEDLAREDLAREDLARPQPRVTFNRRVDLHTTGSGRSVTLRTPFLRYGLERGFSTNHVEVRRANGSSEHWSLGIERLVREKTIPFLSTDKDSLGMSVLVRRPDATSKASDSNDASGASVIPSLMMTWSRRFSPFRGSGVVDTLATLRNILGPVAARTGALDELEAYETPQLVGQVWMLFHESFLQKVFSSEIMTEERIWETILRMVETFDNTGTPLYNQAAYNFSGLPAATSPAARDLQSQACTQLTRHWGRWFCGHFAHGFVPALRAVQAPGATLEQRAAFLRAYSKPMAGTNLYGGLLLLRFLTESMATLKLQPSDALYFQASFSPLELARIIRSGVTPQPLITFGDPRNATDLFILLMKLF